jgi:Flp pilus assembly protein TadG
MAPVTGLIGSGTKTMSTYRAKRQDREQRQPSLPRSRSFLRRLHADEGGTTAIEFAVIGSALMFILFGIVEFSAAMTVGNSLEAATNMSSRLGKTGYVDAEAQQTQEETILAEVERRVGPLIDMSRIRLTHEVFNDFKSLTTPDIFTDNNGDGDTNDPGEWTDVDADGFRDGAEGTGGSGNIVIYRISYPWKVMTPAFNRLLGDDGIITLTAYSVVKNEPY